MNSPRPRPRPLSASLLLVLAAVAVAVLGLVSPAFAGGSAPSCGITWGSLPKEGGGGSGTEWPSVTNVRSGQQACYDRLVVDLAATSGAGYSVQYVSEVLSDAKGDLVPLRGGAFLQIVVHVPAYGQDGASTYAPADPQELVDTSGYATFRQVAFAGSFEGSTSLGLGVRARLPFRVFNLAGPGSGGRLVVDVAHSW